MVRVLVSQRLSEVAFVKTRPTGAEQKQRPEEKAQRLLIPQGLKEGQRVVVAGAVELKAELEELQAKKPAK